MFPNIQYIKVDIYLYCIYILYTVYLTHLYPLKNVICNRNILIFQKQKCFSTITNIDILYKLRKLKIKKNLHDFQNDRY